MYLSVRPSHPWYCNQCISSNSHRVLLAGPSRTGDARYDNVQSYAKAAFNYVIYVAITHGRGAAAKLFVTIDRVPDIDSANPEGLKPDSVEGELILEDVKFSYPSRPNVPVVKGLSLTFRAGKTAALVGASGSGKRFCFLLLPCISVVKLTHLPF